MNYSRTITLRSEECTLSSPLYADSLVQRFRNDGGRLPLIGPVPGHPRILAAYGYGGNGITFGFIAAQLIAGMVGGRRRLVRRLPGRPAVTQRAQVGSG
jgi:hypothetical protein